MIGAIKHWAGVALAIVVVIAVASAVYSFKNPKAGADKHFSDITTNKKRGIFGLAGKEYKTKEVSVEKVTVVDKEDVKDVPEPVRNDEGKELLARAEVEPYKGTTDVWAALDRDSGKASIYSKRRPLPLFAFENDRELGIRYGFVFSKDLVETQIALYGRWTFVRVGAIHLDGYLEGNNRPELKAMLGGSYRW